MPAFDRSLSDCRYYRAGGANGSDACEGGRCLGSNMTMCWNENAQNDDGFFYDNANAKHGVEVMRNASKNTQPFFIAVGIHRPHLPWDVPAHWFSLYPAAEDIELADHTTMPEDYGAAKQWSFDPQSGPRHCGPLKEDKEAPGSNKIPGWNVTDEYALVPDDVAKNFRRGYYAAVSSMDFNMGLVLDELAALQLEERTIVVFLGDHAWQLGDIGEFGKKTNFERATRTPLIFRVPPSLLGKDGMAAHEAARGADGVVRSMALVEFVDIMPSLIDLAGLPMPDVCPPDASKTKLCREGASLKPVLAAPATTEDFRPAAFMQYPHCMHDEGLGWHNAWCDFRLTFFCQYLLLTFCSFWSNLPAPTLPTLAGART